MKSALTLWAAIFAIMGLNIVDSELERHGSAAPKPVQTAHERVQAGHLKFLEQEQHAPRTLTELVPAYVDVIDLAPPDLREWTRPQMAATHSAGFPSTIQEPIRIDIDEWTTTATPGQRLPRFEE